MEYLNPLEKLTLLCALATDLNILQNFNHDVLADERVPDEDKESARDCPLEKITMDLFKRIENDTLCGWCCKRKGGEMSMRKISKAELAKILENHIHWLNEDIEGWENMSADLRSADLRGADLRGAKNIPFIPYSCPDFGMFIGYKKADGYIVELEIPADARRLSATTRKCRCDKAKVLGIYDFQHKLLDIKEVASDRDKNFIYKVDETVTVEDFDEDRWNECSTGIHFFINFQEAVDY